MIQIKKDELIITIRTAAPLEQLLAFKKSLNRVLRFLDANQVESNSGLIYDIENILELAAELEFEQDQMQQITLALNGHKPQNEHLLIA
jgi:hypothetical protein